MKWFQDFNKKDEKTSQRYWLSVNHYPNKFNDKVIFKPFFKKFFKFKQLLEFIWPFQQVFKLLARQVLAI